MHVKEKLEDQDKVSKVMKPILSSSSFKERYNYDARLIPLFDCRSRPHTQGKNKKYIVQRGQFYQCVGTVDCESIDHLDQKNSKLDKTLGNVF